MQAAMLSRSLLLQGSAAPEVQQVQAATLSRSLLLQGSASELQKVQEATLSWSLLLQGSAAPEVQKVQAAMLSRLLLLQGSASELQKVQEAVTLDPTRLSAALLALLAVPVVAWSEFTLKATGQRLTCIVVSVLSSDFDPVLLHLAGHSRRCFVLGHGTCSPICMLQILLCVCLTPPLCRTRVLQSGGQQYLKRCTW